MREDRDERLTRVAVVADPSDPQVMTRARSDVSQRSVPTDEDRQRARSRLAHLMARAALRAMKNGSSPVVDGDSPEGRP